MTIDNAHDEQPLFGRFSREDCGLPPVAPAGKGRFRTAIRFALLLALLWGVGWAAGLISARYREMWLAELPLRIRAAAPGEAAGLLATGRFYARALPGRTGMRRDLAFAALAAAEKSPRRMGYYGNAVNLLAGAGKGSDPVTTFASELTASGVYAEVGDYPAAFAALERAESALSSLPDDQTARQRRLLLVNAQAYYLAIAPEKSGGNPERALHLAQLLVTSRDSLPDGSSASGSAAFLDTLASAWAAAGEREQAAKTQTYALGLAESEGLDVYIRHFDEFGRDGDNGE